MMTQQELDSIIENRLVLRQARTLFPTPKPKELAAIELPNPKPAASAIVLAARRSVIQAASNIKEIEPHCVAMGRADLVIDLTARTIGVEQAKKELLLMIDFPPTSESEIVKCAREMARRVCM